MKTAELIGAHLDYWVARAEGAQPVNDHGRPCLRWPGSCALMDASKNRRYITTPDYSTDWSVGGPIIERDQVMLQPPSRIHYNGGPNDGWKEYDHWRATVSSRTRTLPPANETQVALNIRPVGRGAGETALIAAMRAKVASHYGDELMDEIL